MAFITEAEMDDTGAYKIEVTNESGAASCGFRMDVQGGVVHDFPLDEYKFLHILNSLASFSFFSC